jgi:hypothetical protein
LAKLAAAAAADETDHAATAEGSRAAAATCGSMSGPVAAVTPDMSDDTDVQPLSTRHCPGGSDGNSGGGSVAALAASAAEYIQQLKLTQVGARVTCCPGCMVQGYTSVWHRSLSGSKILA